MEPIEGDFTPLPPVTHFEQQRAAWEIREEESSMWYERFTFYLKEGQDRNIFAAYKTYCEEKGTTPKSYPPQKWYKEASASGWEVRARTYDQYMRALDRRVDEEDRAEARQMRRGLLSKTKKKLETAIDAWEPKVDVLDWETIRSTLKILLELSRGEFGDTEPDKHLAVNVHANGESAFETSVKNVYGE